MKSLSFYRDRNRLWWTPYLLVLISPFFRWRRLKLGCSSLRDQRTKHQRDHPSRTRIVSSSPPGISYRKWRRGRSWFHSRCNMPVAPHCWTGSTAHTPRGTSESLYTSHKRRKNNQGRLGSENQMWRWAMLCRSVFLRSSFLKIDLHPDFDLHLDLYCHLDVILLRCWILILFVKYGW